jgi:type I restriction enzyme S subunit
VVQRITLKPNLNRDFLAIALQNAANNLRGYGVSIESLNFEMWKLLQCPLPSGSEQAAIAAFLDHETAKIDALVAEQERLIALLKEKRQAVISHAVTKGLDPNAPMKDSGVEWLGQVPAHWDIFKFSRQVHIAEGQVDPEIEPFASMVLIAPNHIESGTGRLTAVETASEQGAISGKYLCGSEDVIYSKIRPGLCKATLAPYPCLCSADMYPMRATDKVRQEFLLLILISAQFTAWSVLEADRVAMPKINREALNDLRIVVPPLQEQQCIVLEVASETDRIDDLVGAATRAIFLLRERRAALISAAVTGKIDVRGFVHPEQPAA